jgi:hypothetical protein
MVNDYRTTTAADRTYAGAMPGPLTPERTPGLGAGLCDTCEHQREVRNTRGSTFSLCARSRQEPAYPRYPRLPVLACAGYEGRQAKTS